MAREVNEMMYIKCLAHCLASRKYPILPQDMPESFTYYLGEKNWEKETVPAYILSFCYNVLIQEAVS